MIARPFILRDIEVTLNSRTRALIIYNRIALGRGRNVRLTRESVVCLGNIYQQYGDQVLKRFCRYFLTQRNWCTRLDDGEYGDFKVRFRRALPVIITEIIMIFAIAHYSARVSR